MIFITGASGLVGCALVMELYGQGVRSMRLLIHRNNHIKRLLLDEGINDLNIEYVQASLQDKEELLIVMQGVTHVYHCAALISIVPGAYEKLYAVNVQGLQNVIEASIAVGVKKFIHISSVEAIGYQKGEKIVDESAGFRPNDTFIPYGKSKAIGSIKALELAKSANLPLVILAPAGIIGPYDYGQSRLGRVIWDSYNHKLPAYIDGGFDFVDSRDVAKLAIHAMHHAPAYELYICSGTHASLEQLIGTVTTKKPPKLPITAAKLLALYFEIAHKLGGRDPLITSGSLRITQSHLSYNSSKAKRKLDWQIRPLTTTIKETLAWYKKHFSSEKS
ncbi:NAD-dependent epimerase/dehydratase family protein [Entomospira culicis]|uniref:NAD-dependent epimerase/dehydratase family protein n=1 Tax=Entomospira culicis TaxID=2719989 RepID=A0A968KWN2_9SPIO|nr:NAD-dependent epimerase/dehydratase family protein [Entomospira culicis]NIZ19213.1 NAD-dependent epimerase/dehydratase family protein [Entomospira culicis]NIZ69427.1 NAD-dependent epimerase/dehydratase family protein [Entomospira culicis]WDI36543.1 NAD-dependent epimerase/dehydratase family protein [Entomospira culicis]WDI38169.1 NAD-dependent epimerase/dehydratase family protein [Entomospira culicis]